jgi:subtilisin family serine protease
LLPASIPCDASPGEIAAVWGVDHIDADLVWDNTDPTTCGDGVNLFIIDFGLDVNHDDFQPIESTWTCDHGGCSAGIFAQPDADAYSPGEPDEHGTFVTGIAAARADGALAVGVAPSARLHVYNIMENTPYGAFCIDTSCFSPGLPRGFSDSLLAALDHILANYDAAELDGRAVVNMSFMVDSSGSGGCPYGGSDLLHVSICAAVDAGMVLVSSVADISGVHFPPATYDPVVAVASSGYSDGQDFLSDFAGHSGLNEIDPVIDAAAPGEYITSTFPGDATYTLNYDMSGSSYAAPHVAGALVLCLAAASNLEGDGATVSSQIHTVLGNAGVLDPDPIGKQSLPDVQSRGVINVPDLVADCGAL